MLLHWRCSFCFWCASPLTFILLFDRYNFGDSPRVSQTPWLSMFTYVRYCVSSVIFFICRWFLSCSVYRRSLWGLFCLLWFRFQGSEGSSHVVFGVFVLEKYSINFLFWPVDIYSFCDRVTNVFMTIWIWAEQWRNLAFRQQFWWVFFCWWYDLGCYLLSCTLITFRKSNCWLSSISMVNLIFVWICYWDGSGIHSVRSSMYTNHEIVLYVSQSDYG